MSNHNRSSVVILSILSFTLFCLISPSFGGQKGPATVNGAPLKGVDVKLGKNPGGSPAARTTDGYGKVNWGVLEKGSYYLIVVAPSKQKAAGQGPGSEDFNLETCLVEITGAVGGPIRLAWDFKRNKAFVPPSQQAKSSSPPIYKDITFDSDGHSPLLTTVVRSKSNITNN